MPDDKAAIVQAMGCICTQDKLAHEIVDSAHFVRALNRAIKTYKEKK
jgi:hypothetical protein